jgi:hypothetical protein
MKKISTRNAEVWTVDLQTILAKAAVRRPIKL